MPSIWLVFCDCGFHSVCPLMDEDKRLRKLPDGRDWLRGKLSLALVGKAMLSKSSFQVSADEWGCGSFSWFGLRSNMVGVMAVMVLKFFKKTYASTPWLPGLF